MSIESCFSNQKQNVKISNGNFRYYDIGETTEFKIKSQNNAGVFLLI
jgi:hypothetical protein